MRPLLAEVLYHYQSPFCYTDIVDFLNFLFPKYCINCKKLGDYICANCFAFISFDTDGVCAVCDKPSINKLTHPGCKNKYSIDGVFSSILYKGVCKKLIYNFKYKPYLTDLRKILSDLFYEGLIQKQEFYNVIKNFEKLILVPIPLYAGRERARGYNQAEILSMDLGKRLGFKTFNMLKRIKKTSSQVELSKKQRKENIKGAFEINSNLESYARGAGAFLVDDVFTTGSTLTEAARILKRNGMKNVWALTLARD